MKRQFRLTKAYCIQLAPQWDIKSRIMRSIHCYWSSSAVIRALVTVAHCTHVSKSGRYQGHLNHHWTSLQTSLGFKVKCRQVSWAGLTGIDMLSPSLAKLQLQLTQILGVYICDNLSCSLLVRSQSPWAHSMTHLSEQHIWRRHPRWEGIFLRSTITTLDYCWIC